jgi:hypothetical protein
MLTLFLTFDVLPEDQFLMEDYELVAILRKRAALIPKMSSRFEKEELKIISGEPPALCSPRRWQKFGVLYVTYASEMGQDALFSLYYGQVLPKRTSILSPWVCYAFFTQQN